MKLFVALVLATITDASGWSMELPADYQPIADRGDLTHLHVFHPNQPDEAVVGMQLKIGAAKCAQLERLPKLPDGIEVRRVKWKSSEVCVLRVADGDNRVRLLAEFTNSSTPMHLFVTGRVENEAALRGLHEKIIATVKKSVGKKR